MQLNAGTAVLSDIVVNHVGTLYGSAAPTLAGLCDLAQLCQAAVLHDRLVASPSAYDRSELLQQLDFVDVVRPGDGSTETPEQEQPADRQSVTIDATDKGTLRSDSPLGELLLAYAFSELMQEDGMFGSLFNPNQLDPAVDRGSYLLGKLPLFLFALQSGKGAADFEDEAAREHFLSAITPHLDRYDTAASHFLALHETFGVDVVFSTLEQPFADSIQVERAVGAVQTPELVRRLHAKVQEAIVADRSQFFERWNLPALGLMVLGRAKNLGRLPKQLHRVRAFFDKARNALVRLEAQKHEILTAGGGLDDRRYREARHIDQGIRQAFEAFDSRLEKARLSPTIKWSEAAFNMPKYLRWMTSFGLGTVDALIEVLDLKARRKLCYIPGLQRAVFFLKRCDRTPIVSIVERFLGGSIEGLGLQLSTLQLAAEKIELYSRFADGRAPRDDDAVRMTFEDQQMLIPHSQFWFRLCAEEAMQRFFLGRHEES